MTDQSSTLTPAATRQIISHIHEAIAVLDRHRGRISAQHIQMRAMLHAVKAQLEDQLRALESGGEGERQP